MLKVIVADDEYFARKALVKMLENMTLPIHRCIFFIRMLLTALPVTRRCSREAAPFQTFLNHILNAACTGYNNPSHFTQTFRRYYGMSPKEYRKRLELG